MGFVCRRTGGSNSTGIGAGRATVTDTTCPYCGLPQPAASTAGGGAVGPLDLIYREVRRIREMAQSQADRDQQRIAALSHELDELRATVARLRGPGQVPAPVRGQQVC